MSGRHIVHVIVISYVPAFLVADISHHNCCCDELTGDHQVSIDQERRLFSSAKSLGITLISISQRLSLPEHHAQELQFGQANEEGFTLDDISHAAAP